MSIDESIPLSSASAWYIQAIPESVGTMTTASLDGYSEANEFKSRFNRISRRQHGGSRSMLSDTRRKSCITDFEEDLGKASVNPFQELFAKFCSSSTIHGTYFWIASGSPFSRILWGLIVILGITSATWIINSSFKAWQEHPVITSVMQKSIEEIHFPAITICPLDDTRFGFMEEQLNEKSNQLNTEDIVTDLARILYARHPKPSGSDCLLEQCDKLLVKVRNGDSIYDQQQAEEDDLTWSLVNSGESEFDVRNSCYNCPDFPEFKRFFATVEPFLIPDDDGDSADPDEYHNFILDQFTLKPLHNRSVNKDEWKKRAKTTAMPSGGEICDLKMSVGCHKLVADFRFLIDFKAMIVSSAAIKEETRKGTLLRMLLTQMGDDPELQESVFKHYVSPEIFHNLYAGEWLNISSNHELAKIPLHNLIAMLANREQQFDKFKRAKTSSRRFRKSLLMTVKDLKDIQSRQSIMSNDLKIGSDLLRVMQMSLHPPHALEPTEGQDVKVVPNPAFPFCFFGAASGGGKNKAEDGSYLSAYQEHYCNSFQTTFNEYGLCYTFNNADQGFHDYFHSKNEKLKSPKRNFTSNDFIKVRKVTGCGKNRGLQLVLDSQRMTSLLPKEHLTKGFKVFVTLPGVVTSKVPYWADPTFNGEHNFFIHGIHVIKSSNDFKEWNRKNKACYFPDGKKLSFFKHYSQDNCLLECRLKKMIKICGCSPWYIKQDDVEVCTYKGNHCIEKLIFSYSDELIDRKECDCLNDCEMVHFFSTMQREPFNAQTTESRPQRWFDSGRGLYEPSGILANYLMDPQHVFSSRVAKNITKLANNLSHDYELAEKRFEEDIAIMNFFFDTPIITEITLELRTSIFDMISAIGGTLGLFTGISVITLVEVAYWSGKFLLVCFQSSRKRFTFWSKCLFGHSTAATGVASSKVSRAEEVFSFRGGVMSDNLGPDNL